MSRVAFLTLLASTSILFGGGCGGEPTPAAAAPRGSTTGPHGGIAVPLPGDQGYAEVVVERIASKGTAKAPSKLAVYFLNADLKAPLSPLPTNVAVKAILPTGDTANPTLTLEPKSSDPLAAGRHVSPTGDFDYDELSGEVTATVDGASVSLPFAFR
jgi:hypothetical protein